MITRIRHRCAALGRRVRRCEAGAAAIEFALIGSVFITLLIAVFEYGYVLFVGASIEAAVLNASRYGITGESEPGRAREDQIRAIIADRAFVAPEKLTITTKVYQTFAQIGQPEPFNDKNKNSKFDKNESFSDVNGNGTWDEDMGVAGLGGPGDIVLYRVEYAATALTGLFTPLLGIINHQATVAVRNEPYGS